MCSLLGLTEYCVHVQVLKRVGRFRTTEEDAAVEAAVASRLNSMERPPPWIDVTTALRFMVEDSRIVLHPVRLPGTQLFVHKRDTAVCMLDAVAI